jgi:hypothetical protein
MNTLVTQSLSSVSWGPSVQIEGLTHFQVTGTWVGLVVCQVSKNDVEWSGFLVATSNSDQTFTGNGKYYRFGIQTYTSGTAVCTLYQSEASPGTSPGNPTTAIVNTTASIVLTSSDLGKTIRVNSSSSRTVTLPSVGLENDGSRVRIAKLSTGNVVIQAADTDKIGDSTAGGTCTNSTSTEVFAWLDLEYVHASTTWIISGHGTWVTA